LLKIPTQNANVKQMRTSIRLLAPPKSMRSIDDATQREQRHGWIQNTHPTSHSRRRMGFDDSTRKLALIWLPLLQPHPLHAPSSGHQKLKLS